MKPNQTYAYLGNTRIDLDTVVLAQCYLPILGLRAFSLYHYLVAQYDFGKKVYTLSHLLNQLDMGIDRLERALDCLSALGLISIYQDGEQYTFVLQPALNQARFLKHPLLSALLAQKIGEPAVEQLRQQDAPQGTNISKTFSEVFEMDGQPQVVKPLSYSSNAFPMDSFESMMHREGYHFADRATDTVALYHLAEQSGRSWMELYQLAKETAVQKEFSMKRLSHRLQATKPSSGELTAQEQTVAKEAKLHRPLEFLAILKSTRNAQIIPSEQALIQDLTSLGLLDEVINIALMYTFTRVDSANLNEKYAKKVANDFSYKGIHTAEEAIIALRDQQANPATNHARSGKKTPTSNVPEWSKKEVQTEFTAEEEAQMEALYQQMLEEEQKGGD